MAAKGRLQSRQQRKTLLAQGGQIATNAAKSLVVNDVRSEQVLPSDVSTCPPI